MNLVLFNPSPPNATYMHHKNQASNSSDNGLVPNHNYFLVKVKWTFRNKLQWNFNQNRTFFIHKYASEDVVCEMVAILSKGRWVKKKMTKKWTAETKKDQYINRDL